jgi:hypothetical protein
MREDTSPETPFAKSNSDPPPPPDRWKGPDGRGAHEMNDPLFGSTSAGGARFDWAFGSGRVRTYHASGPIAAVLAIIVFIAIGALISLFFLFALGLGTALALGTGAAAALGLGANMFRRRLTSASRNELGPGNG